MKTTGDSLVEIVTAEPKKYSQAELGRMLVVSRERVHKLVKKFDLHHLVRPAYPARNGAAQLLNSMWTFQLTGVVFVNILQPRLGIKCLRRIEVDILQLRPGLKYLRGLYGGTIKKGAPSSITCPRALPYNNRRTKMTIWAGFLPGQWFTTLES